MKRHLYSGLLMAAAALLCLTGCKKDGEGEKIMLGTQFEKAVSAQKTYLGENNTVCWSTGDEVKVNNKTCEVSSDGIAVTKDEHYYAVYPAVDGNSVGESGGTVVIPATQTYTKKDGHQVLNGPMAARLDSRSGILHFKNLYSLLKVTVSADDKNFTVNTITVTATGETPKALAGTYDFSFKQSQTGKTDSVSINTFAEMSKDSSKSVKLTGINSIVAANNDADFYLVAHPMAAQKLTVRVSGLLEGKAVTYIYSTGNARTLARNSIGGLGVNLQQLEPKLSGAGIGRFKIGENTYVTFAPGNLQYQASTGTWRFAEHQWDIIGNNPGNSTTSNRKTQVYWIDLFSWGMSGALRSKDKRTAEPSSVRQYNEGCAHGYGMDIANTDFDWGVYNAIYNPQIQTTDVKGTWRTLTKDEWTYLINNNKCYYDVSVAGISGVIIAPSNMETTDVNAISEAEWNEYEKRGCVFLPYAGKLIGGDDPNYTDVESWYWTSTTGSATFDYAFHFDYKKKEIVSSVRYPGSAVRLAHNIE